MNKEYEAPESEVIYVRMESNYLATGIVDPVPIDPEE